MLKQGQVKIMPPVKDTVIFIKNGSLPDFFFNLSIYAPFLLVEIKNNSNIMVKYHPKFWTEGIYQCCRQTEKLAPGCEKYNLFENSKYICFQMKLFWHIFLLFLYDPVITPECPRYQANL